MSVSLPYGTLIRGSAQKGGLNSSSLICFNFHTSVPVMLFTDKTVYWVKHILPGESFYIF